MVGTAGAQERGEDWERFVHDLSDLMVAAGTQRMAARVFAVLIASDEGRLTAAEISEQLRASPAAVSGAVRYLEQISLVRRTRPLGSRRDVIALMDELWYEAFVDRTPILVAWAALMAEGARVLGEGTPAGRRLTTSADFFAFMARRFPDLLEEWRAERGG